MGGQGERRTKGLRSHPPACAGGLPALPLQPRGDKRKFCVNMVEGDLLLAYQRFRTKAQEARTIEGRNVGLDIMPSIAAYKGACIEGRKILVNIDEIKVNDLEKLETRAYRFITAKEFIVGLLTGLVSSLIIYAIQIYF